MSLSKKYLSSFLLFICLSTILVLLTINTYKPVHSVFPQYAELEIQFYYLAIAMIFGLSSMLFWFSFTGIGQRIFNLQKNINISKFFLFGLIFLELSYIIYFYRLSYPALLKTQNFSNAGIITEDSFAIPILILMVLILFINFFSITKIWKIKYKKLFYIVSGALIILLSFKIAKLNALDYSYFAGPINDVLHGKYLLYNSPSQYGFLSIIFLSIIFKLVPLGLMNLTIVNALIQSAGFLLVFILLQLLYRNKILTLFAIITIILLNYVIQIVPQFSILQTGFLRFGMWVAVALSLYLKESYSGTKYKTVFNILPYILLVLSFFWVLDNGFYILLAFVFYNSFNHLNSSLISSVRLIFFDLIKIGLSLSLGFLVVKLIYSLFFGISPKWSYFSSDPALYLAGFGMLPLPNSSWHWFIMLGYLLMFTYFFVLKRYKKDLRLDLRESVASFVLFYGIFQFSYYMGRSHLNNLHHIIIPFLICLFFIIDNFLLWIKNTGKLSYAFLGGSIVSLLFALPFYFIFVQGTKNLIEYNFFTTLHILQSKKQIEKENNDAILSPTVTLLKEKYGDYINKNGITLISMNDTWFLIELKISNNIESNNLRYFVQDAPLKKIGHSILAKKYKYIFVDTSMNSDFGQVNNIYTTIKDSYKTKEQIGSLLVLERI